MDNLVKTRLKFPIDLQVAQIQSREHLENQPRQLQNIPSRNMNAGRWRKASGKSSMFFSFEKKPLFSSSEISPICPHPGGRPVPVGLVATCPNKTSKDTKRKENTVKKQEKMHQKDPIQLTGATFSCCFLLPTSPLKIRRFSFKLQNANEIHVQSQLGRKIAHFSPGFYGNLARRRRRRKRKSRHFYFKFEKKSKKPY